MGKLIMVSNRLPVKIDAEGNTSRTTGGLASALEGAKLEREQVWVGWPGGVEDDFEDVAILRDKMQEAGIHPVFLDQEELDGFYEGYSNSTLWPVLHYMVERAKFSCEWWETYQQVNRKFADVVLTLAEEGDQIWIHDYHLFLLPTMLREQRQELRIGFFLHTPFCSSEIFRALPNRSEILTGVLGADLIGFHTYSYMRHFRSSLLRVLGWEAEMDGLRHGGREVRMGVYPIGHNHSGFKEIIQANNFPELVLKQRKQLAGKRMILNVERLDYTKGLPEKLGAMRRFLELNPDLIDDILFVLIAVPSRQGVEEYDELTEEVQREVGAINGEYGRVGHSPVQFLHRGFPMAELAAFYVTSEICMVSPLRDGMNLVAKEYLDVQRSELVERPGVLILSEFAGATNELSHAIHVNPYDVDAVASAIKRALVMPDEERVRRLEPMQERVVKYDSGIWARNFLEQLNCMVNHEEQAVVMDLNPLVTRLVEKIRTGGKLGLFLDYDGTLRDFVDNPDQATPGKSLLKLLADLQGSDHIRLALVSGRPPDFLEGHFAGMGITLVGEHGYRWLEDGKGKWELLNPYVHTEWKETILEHLEAASLMTPGTNVEVKQSALVWHYRKADPEFGEWRAKDLLEELTSMCANLPVSVHHGKKIVEVSSLQVNKGEAVDFLIGKWKPDMALVAGDDQTDETMISLNPEGVDFSTIKVGAGATRAAYRTDITGLRNFLDALRNGIL